MSKIWYVVYALLALGGIAMTQHHPFFWDTVQFAGRQALFFYDNQFSQWILPTAIDSGHPPGFGIYLATWWRLLQPSLALSHWAMLPFLLLTLWSWLHLGRLLNFPVVGGLPILILLDPVVLTQALLVSPDLVVMAGFSLALLGYLGAKKLPMLLGSLLLVAVSLRGMMVVAALAVVTLPGPGPARLSWRSWWQWVFPFVPAGLLASFFLLHHYLATGWVGYHADSPWAPSFAKIGWAEVPRHLAILGWRLLDYGRIFAVMVLVALWWPQRRTWPADPQTQRLILLALALTGIQAYSFLAFKGVNLHRYLLPLFLTLDLLLWMALAKSGWTIRHQVLAGLVAGLGLVSGHTWIYPPHIAQSWDTTLAHWPHHRNLRAAIAYLDRHGIPLEEVGTAFPEIGPRHWRDLSGRFTGFRAKDFNQNQRVLYLRTMNDFSDAELRELQEHWRVEAVFGRPPHQAKLFLAPAAPQ